MVTVAEALQDGTRHFEAGRLADAKAAYRQALELDPQNAFALHQLGALAMKATKIEEAVGFLLSAIRADGSQATYHANLGACYRQLGKQAEAEQAYRNALRLQPGLTPARVMLGQLLQSLGRLDEAAECFRRILLAESKSPDAHFDLGHVLHRQGELDEAQACYERALALDPNHALAHTNLGTVLKQRGATEDAIRHFQAAIKQDPRNVAALTNLGSAYELAGFTDDAVAAHQAALAVDPASITARYNLGTVLQKMARLDEAHDCFQKVLDINPRHALSWFGLAGVCYKRNDMPGALAACEKAFAAGPPTAQGHAFMGVMLNERGYRDEAIAELRRAIELDPTMPVAHGNLGIALHMTGHIDEGIAEHRLEIEVNPKSSSHHSNLLFCLNYHPRLDDQTIFEEHLAWAARHAEPLTAASAPHTNDRSPDRRLRVGYVSPHFFDHAVNFFTEPILASHDHEAFEVFIYSDVTREDQATARLRGYADCWRTIVGRGHEQVSREIRADQIDILVDLTGHIGENRMPVFARKPAPIQVTYIGYQATTGMRAMDYRLTDAYTDLPGVTDRYYTERLARLPTTFFCFEPSPDACEVGPLPAPARGYVTFGSFNNFAKVTPQVLETWAEIMHAVPKSRLLVLAMMTPSLERYVRATLAGLDIPAERLEFTGHQARPDYFKRIDSVDLALDPFPFIGRTTTCDCIWQGVPVVSLAGRNYVSRFGSSGLNTLGLDDLIADSRDQYKRIAVGLAHDLPRLGALRAGLRPRMAASPLLDFKTFTRNLEAEYRQMWHRYLEG